MRQYVFLMKVLKSTSSYFFVMVAMDTVVNKWETQIGWVKIWDSLNLARKLYTANELIFAEYCEIHACRKREMKSGYQRWYRVNRSRLFLPTRSQIGPEFWPGNVALSCLMLVIVQDIWTFVKVILVSWSWVMLEAQDLWSHLFAFDVNLSLIDHQGRYTLPRELYSYSWSELSVD